MKPLILLIVVFLCILRFGESSKAIIYYGRGYNGWTVGKTLGSVSEPNSYYNQNGIATIYFQLVQTGTIFFSNNNSINVAQMKYFNFDLFWPSACAYEFKITIGNQSVNLGNLTTAEWNHISIPMENFNSPVFIDYIEFQKVDVFSCDAWMSNVYFNSLNETINGWTTSPDPITSSPAAFTTQMPFTTGMPEPVIPCSTKRYTIWDNTIEPTWTPDYFYALGRAPDGLVKWEDKDSIYLQAGQWGGFTVRRTDNTYIDISQYTYLNFKFYWLDNTSNYTIRSKLKIFGQPAEKYGLYISSDNMKVNTWNQITIPLSSMQLDNYQCNQIEIQKKDVITVDAYITDIYFADGINCKSSAPYITFSSILIMSFILILL